MKLSKIFLAALIAVFGATSELYAKPQQSLKIVATVNDEIISSADFQNQLKLFLLTTKIPFNEHTRNMILERVLNSAIDEKIKLQSAEKNDIEVTEKEISGSISLFEKNNKIPNGQMKSILREYQHMLRKLQNCTENELRIMFSFGFFLCISPDIIFSYLEQNPALHFQYACYNQ